LVVEANGGFEPILTNAAVWTNGSLQQTLQSLVHFPTAGIGVALSVSYLSMLAQLNLFSYQFEKTKGYLMNSRTGLMITAVLALLTLVSHPNIASANEKVLVCEIEQSHSSDEGRVAARDEPDLWALRFKGEELVEVIPPYRCTSGERVEISSTEIHFSCRRERLFPSTQTSSIERYSGAYENRMAFDEGGFVVHFGSCKVAPPEF